MTQTKTKHNSGDGGRITHRLASILLAFVVAGGILFGGLAGPATAAGDVTITVQDTSGDTLGGVDVSLHNASTDSQVASGTTDSSGEVTFSSQSDDDYYAQADPTGYTNETTDNITVNGSAVSDTLTLYETNIDVQTQTVDINNDSVTVWAEVENLTDRNDDAAGYEVEFRGLVNSTDDNGTTLDTKVQTAETGTQTFEYSLNDSDYSDYEAIEVAVVGVEDDSVDSFEAGTYQKVGGGGGSAFGTLLGGDILGIPMILIVGGAIGLALWMRE